MRYLAKVSYDGSGFFGFQRLNEERCVQGELERAISIVNKKNTIVKGASRTDKGVHAYGQMIHFDLDYEIPVDRLKCALNDILDRDVRILEIKKVDDEFHARFKVLKKRYIYKINLGEYDALKDKYFLQYEYKLDISKMKQCSKVFLGVHDFRNFVAGQRDDYKASVDKIKFNLKDNILEIEFIGKSFYRYMVRNMVGAMIDVARGKASILDVKMMILEPNIDKHLQTASANGLYLMDIWY